MSEGLLKPDFLRDEGSLSLPLRRVISSSITPGQKEFELLT